MVRQKLHNCPTSQLVALQIINKSSVMQGWAWPSSYCIQHQIGEIFTLLRHQIMMMKYILNAGTVGMSMAGICSRSMSVRMELINQALRMNDSIHSIAIHGWVSPLDQFSSFTMHHRATKTFSLNKNSNSFSTHTNTHWCTTRYTHIVLIQGPISSWKFRIEIIRW